MSAPQPSRFSRRDLLRYSAVGLAAVGGGSLLGACSTTDPGNPQAAAGITARVENGEPIRIAIGNEPPYTKLLPSGEVTGAAPDVARAVLERLGAQEVEGITTPYDTMIPGLDADRWDMIAAGLFMNQSRCAEVLYTSPDIVSTESLALPAGNPKNIQDVADLKSMDVKVAVLAASFELKTARSWESPRASCRPIRWPRTPCKGSTTAGSTRCCCRRSHWTSSRSNRVATSS